MSYGQYQAFLFVQESSKAKATSSQNGLKNPVCFHISILDFSINELHMQVYPSPVPASSQ